jgi:Zn-dependent protease
MADLASGLIYYVVFLFSTTLHEAAHAWAAMLGGDLTAYHGGQVSLDPRPHIKREPVGMVLLPLLSVVASGWPMGFASAPFDPRWALRHPKRAAWMSLAGPGANLTLVVLAGLAMRLGGLFGVFYGPHSIRFDHLVETDLAGMWPTLGFLLSVFFSLNLVLACLNLIPLPPLDGSAAIPLLLSDQSAARYQQYLLTHGRTFSFLGLFAAWQLFNVIFHPLFLFAANLLYPGAHYG